MSDDSPVKYEFKKDRYSKARGGNSRFFDIFCGACNAHILLYQKDGSGALLRMYLDRIFAPPDLARLQFGAHDKKDVPNLECQKCHNLIGVPMVYESENRLAIRLIRGSFAKKNSTGIYPPSQKR